MRSARAETNHGQERVTAILMLVGGCGVVLSGAGVGGSGGVCLACVRRPVEGVFGVADVAADRVDGQVVSRRVCAARSSALGQVVSGVSRRRRRSGGPGWPGTPGPGKLWTVRPGLGGLGVDQFTRRRDGSSRRSARMYGAGRVGTSQARSTGQQDAGGGRCVESRGISAQLSREHRKDASGVPAPFGPVRRQGCEDRGKRGISGMRPSGRSRSRPKEPGRAPSRDSSRSGGRSWPWRAAHSSTADRWRHWRHGPGAGGQQDDVAGHELARRCPGTADKRYRR